MAYTTIDKPTDYFNTVLFSGNETARSITGVGFQPDWVWIKDRSQTYNHHLFDSVRGATKRLKSDVADAQSTNAQTLTAFGSDGFSLGTDNATNGNGSNVVSWNWLAGTSFSNDASATSVGSIDSTGSTNSTAGFSIVKYTGTGSSATVAHNLGAVPHFMIFKSMDASENWVVYHQTNGAGGYIYLNTTAAAGSGNTTIFNNTNPTSSVFTINTDGNINNSGDDYIAYCFTEKQGYSKFGSYEGNANTNGPFVYTGFKPAWIMVKATDAAKSWYMWDNKRSTSGSNVVDDQLLADTTDSEFDGSNIDMLSNGFKFRGSGSGENGSGTNYIYMAFAESPFVSSSGVPTVAR